MERKALFAWSEGKVYFQKHFVRCLVLNELKTMAELRRFLNVQIRGLYNLFCWQSRLSGRVLPASQPKVGGVQMFRSPASRCL